MNLLGVELAGVAGLHNGDRILKHLRPVEAAPEDLACEGARTRVVAALSAMDVLDQHSAFLGRDAFERDAIWALAVQVSLEDAVGFCLSSDSLCFRIFLGEDPLHQVVFELVNPACFLVSRRQQQTLPCVRTTVGCPASGGGGSASSVLAAAVS